MSIPGSGSRPHSIQPSAAHVPDTILNAPTTATGISEAAPVMKNKQEQQVENDLTREYLGLHNEHQKANLESKICDHDHSDSSSLPELQNNRSTDVNRSDFSYSPEVVRVLWYSSGYAELGSLFEDYQGIAKEPDVKSSADPLILLTDKMSPGKVTELASALNKSNHPIPDEIGLLWDQPIGLSNAIQFLSSCKTVSRLSVIVEDGCESYLKCIASKKEIKQLCIPQIIASNAGEAHVTAYLEMLGNMPQLEKFSLCVYESDVSREIVSPTLKKLERLPNLKYLNIFNPQFLSAELLSQIASFVRTHPNIVEVFDSSCDIRQAMIDMDRWSNNPSPQESQKIFFEICDLIDKNRARQLGLLVDQYARIFSEHHNGEEIVPSTGPYYLDPDSSRRVVETVLDGSKSIKEFTVAMDALRTRLQQLAVAGTPRANNTIGNSVRQTRTTADVVSLATTSATTTTITTPATPGAVGVGSIALQAVSHQATSAAAADGAKPIQLNEAKQTTTPEDVRIDTGYESDVLIDSSDDDE